LIRDKNDIAIQQAAQHAIDQANARGGYKGQKFELITRSCDGPWGRTSKETVALIYEDQVPIVVTALDGRNAHLAEQVTAKSHVVMLSTLSSDPTLSRAYVPWYFRMVPDDKQQAEILVEQIFERDGAKKVAVVSLDDYDGKMSAEIFTEVAVAKGHLKPELMIGLHANELFSKLEGNRWDAVVLAGSSENASQIIAELKFGRTYAFQNLTNFVQAMDPVSLRQIKFAIDQTEDNEQWRNFEALLSSKTGGVFSPSLAYVFDGITMAIEAVKSFGPDPEAVRMGFKELKFEGVTGKIEFGRLGDRIF
jgi:ABC-type branched-subunit amino acid transport system substrate-binding protein